MAVGDKVDALIKEHPVVVFSKSFCPHCAAAKKTLKEAAGKGAPQAVVIELDQTSEFDMQETQDYLRDLTGARSVPRIFIKGQSIGGNSDLQALKSQDALENLLRPKDEAQSF